MNTLSADKKLVVISSLIEGNSVRSTERITGVHRDTICRLLVLALAEMQKKQYLSFSAVLREVAALRETIRALDPTFADVLDQKRKEQETLLHEAELKQVRLIDLLIRRMKERVTSA